VLAACASQPNQHPLSVLRLSQGFRAGALYYLEIIYIIQPCNSRCRLWTLKHLLSLRNRESLVRNCGIHLGYIYPNLSAVSGGL
jgi:hypothetical protein